MEFWRISHLAEEVNSMFQSRHHEAIVSVHYHFVKLLYHIWSSDVDTLHPLAPDILARSLDLNNRVGFPNKCIVDSR